MKPEREPVYDGPLRTPRYHVGYRVPCGACKGLGYTHVTTAFPTTQICSHCQGSGKASITVAR